MPRHDVKLQVVENMVGEKGFAPGLLVPNQVLELTLVTEFGRPFD